MFSDCNGHLVIKWTFSDGNENIIIERRRDVRAKLLFLSSNLLLFDVLVAIDVVVPKKNQMNDRTTPGSKLQNLVVLG